MTGNLIIQTLILPLIFTFIVFIGVKPYGKTRVLLLLAFCMLMFYWIRGFPSLLPNEALDWVLYFTIVFTLTTLVKSNFLRVASSTLIFAIGLLTYSWSIIFHSNVFFILSEIILLSSILFYVSLSQARSNYPALTILISTSGLTLASFISGSALVAQLAGVIAVISGSFALFEIIKRKTGFATSMTEQLLLSSLFLALLFITRTYTDLAYIPTAALAISLFLGLVSNSRLNWLFSLSLSVGAVIFVSINSSRV